MTDSDFLEGITSQTVTTDRIDTHVLTAGPEDGTPVILLHGNVSSARFWEETMLALPEDYRGLAPDLRGYGNSETKPVDGTRGVADFAEDIQALVEQTIDEDQFHLVGWSNGGGVAMQYAIDHPERLRSLTLVNPLSPYGFGGTADVEGTPCWPDYAGSGGGIVEDEFVQRLEDNDRSSEADASPRNVLYGGYFAPEADIDLPEDREEAYVTAMLNTATGDANYPGEGTASEHWPYTAPGEAGVNNAVSPKYCDLSGLADIDPQPPILWIRGAQDLIVSDTSLFDPGYLGQIGEIPDWPGEDAYPPQPMVSQTRSVLEEYADTGGTYTETVIEDAGHTPHVERPDEFQDHLFDILEDT